jgi:proline dehydrogenase
VYTLCSIPLLIDYAPSLLHTFTHSPIPGVKAITEAIVRRTFFAQFVPGETVEECLPTMADLRKVGIGAVLNYSAEVSLDGDEKLTDEKRRLFETKRLKEVEKALIESGRFENQIGQQGLKQGSTSFALKVVCAPLFCFVKTAQLKRVDRPGRPGCPTSSIKYITPPPTTHAE